MPISNKTQLCMVVTLEQWQNDHKVSNEAIHNLLIRLANIPGNKSYEITMTRVRDHWAEIRRLP